MPAQRTLTDLSLRIFLAWLLLFPSPLLWAEETTDLTAAVDATVKQGTPDSNDGTGTGLLAANNQRTLVRFDMTSLSPTTSIKTSFLKMKMINAPSSSRDQAAHRVTGATQWTETGVTWNSRDGATSWTTAGGDFNATAAATVSSGTTANTVLTWTILGDGAVSNIPQGWLDGSVLNRGLLVKDTVESPPPPDPAWWDNAYSYRRKITVSAGSSNIPSGYATRLTFDHAALVSAAPSKSLASGNDVRIVYWNGSTWTELSRVLASGSAWNNAATRIFFKTNASIAASGSDSGYYLYYGNSSAGSPPTSGVASARFFLAESLGETQTSSTSYANKVQLQFTPGATSESWVVVATWRQREVGNLGVLTNSIGRGRVQLNGATRTGNDIISYKMSGNIWKAFAVLFRITGVSTQQTVRIDFRADSGTDAIDNARILAFMIPDPSAADIRYLETLTPTVDNVNPTTSQALTFSPSSAGDYIWMLNGYFHEAPGGSTTGGIFAVDETGADQQHSEETYISGTNVEVIPLTHFQRRTLTTGSKTFSIRFQPDTVTGSNRQGLTQLLFRTDVFEGVEVASDATQTTTTQTSYQTKASLTTATQASARDYVYLAVMMHDDVSGGTLSLSQFAEVRLGGAPQLEDEVALDRSSYDTQIAWGYAENTTGNRTVDLRFRSETSAVTTEAQYAHILALRYKEPGTSLDVEENVSGPASLAWWDASYEFRQKITVTAGAQAVPNGYSAALTFDHAALVSAVPSKSLASGNDARIVRWNGSTWVQLDRVLDDNSSWNNASTKIWFRTQAAISASGTDDSYYLYYGNSAAGSPPASPTSIWDFYDNFDDNDITDWTSFRENRTNPAETACNPGGFATINVTGGVVNIDPTEDFCTQGLRHNTLSVSNAQGFALRTRGRLREDPTKDDQLPTMWYVQLDGSNNITQLYMSSTRNASHRIRRYTQSASPPGVDLDNTTTSPPSLDVWYIYESFTLPNGDMRWTRDGTQLLPAAGWVNDTTFTSGGIGIGGERVVVEFDWILKRKLVNPEPTTPRDAEERQAPRYGAREQALDADRPKLEVHHLRNVTLDSLTPGVSEVTINWTFPPGSTSSHYDGVLFAQKQGGSAPTFAPTDNTSYTVGQEPVAGEFIVANTSSFSTVSFVMENGPDYVVLPGTQYSYKAYTHDNNTITGAATPSPPHYAFGTTGSATTTNGGGTTKNWSYKTAATTLAAPGLDAGDKVIIGGNDNILHTMDASNGGRRYRPDAATETGTTPTMGAIQSRSPIIPSNKTTHACACDVAYIGTGDGKVYAFNATTGAKLWESAVLTNGGPIQGAPAVQVKAFSNVSYPHAFDLVIVGTRNTSDTTTNKIVGLNGNTGATVWTFTGGGANPNLDIINSTPMIDLAANTVWLTSRAGATGTQASFWKLDTTALGPSANLLQSITLSALAASDRDIDGSPILNGGRTFLYATTTTGFLVAIEVSNNTVYTVDVDTSSAISGVGFPIPLANGSNDDIYLSTTGSAARDGVHKRVFDRTGKLFVAHTFGSSDAGGWDTTAIDSASTPIFTPPPAALFIYVGASDGKLHKIDPSDGTDLAQRTLNASATVGAPSYDTVSSKFYAGATDGRIYSFDLF